MFKKTCKGYNYHFPYSSYLWWFHSLAPGKSLSCFPDSAAASQSLGEWFCQSTTWRGCQRKHGTHKTRLVRGKKKVHVGWRMRKDKARVSRHLWKRWSNYLHAGSKACFMPMAQLLLTWTLRSVWDDWRGRRQEWEMELLHSVSWSVSEVSAYQQAG